jgi:hypothetical protein
LRQVVKDASAFYLLGYASTRTPLDDGKFHSIKVRVKGQKVDVRARHGYWSPKPADTERARAESAAEPPKAMAAALGALSAARSDRALDVWAGVSRGLDGTPTVTAAWTPRGAAAGLAGATVTIVDQHAGASQTIDAPLDARHITWSAAPGAHQLHVTVRNAQDQTLADVSHAIDVPKFDAAALTLGSPVVWRARNPSELKTIGEGAPTPPFAGREFTRSDRLFVRVPVYGSAASMAMLSARLLNRAGAALLPLTIAPKAAGDGVYEIVLPLSAIARGDYVIAVAAEAGDDRAEAFVPLRIVS